MIDNVSLQIEELAVLRESFRDAFFEFMENHNIYDPEDLYEILNPILKAKIKQEFIDAKVFPKGSEHCKKSNLLDL